MAISPINPAQPNMSVLNEHIYGYKHGIRPLVLQVESMKDKDVIEKRLKRDNLNYMLNPAPGGRNLNVFFGDKPCVDVIKSFNQPELGKYTPEQDFILGVLLGYDKTKQCERYLKLKEKENQKKQGLNLVA